MKLFVDQKSLAFALNIVNKAVSLTNTLPVLSNILLKAEGKKLFFSSTNLEIAIHYWIPAEVHNEGSITIPAKLLTHYIHLLHEDESIEFKLEEGLTLFIKSKSSRTKIKGIAADEFPLIPQIEQPQIFTLSASVLKQAIEQVVFAASLNISRPTLSGILFSIEKDICTLVATDSYRLAEKKIPFSNKNRVHLQSIIPAKTILELGKILLNITHDASVEISISQNQALFKIENIEFISRLIEGSFPDYEKIIPQNTCTKAQVKVSDFLLAVKKVSLFVSEDSNNIRISVTHDGQMTLSTGETQVGEETTEIPIQIEGENNQIGLNFQFLLDILQSIGSEVVILEMDTKISPVILRPYQKDDYIHIIMPLKI